MGQINKYPVSLHFKSNLMTLRLYIFQDLNIRYNVSTVTLIIMLLVCATAMRLYLASYQVGL